MTDQRAKSLRWLANQFPAVEHPKDDTDRISTCIHLYCTSGADTIDTLSDQLAALQSESAEKDREIEGLRKELTKAHTMDTLTDYNQDFLRTEIKRVEAERDAAIGDISHVCATCGQFEDGACPVLAYKDYPKGCEHWQWRGAQGEG